MSNTKRQTMVIAVLILLIACAGWFAKKFNDTALDQNAMTATVDNQKENTNFFVESRLTRENQRSIMKQEFEKIKEDKTTSMKARDAASFKLMELISKEENENKIEKLVKERGYEDALCFINDNGVELCVKTKENLTSQQVNVLKDIIVRTTGRSPSNIVIKPSNE